eukprot:3450252-Rhodomonas_salina.1
MYCPRFGCVLQTRHQLTRLAVQQITWQFGPHDPARDRTRGHPAPYSQRQVGTPCRALVPRTGPPS